MNLKKNNGDKKKHPLLNSIWQIILLIIIIVLFMMVVDNYDSVGDVNEVYSYVLTILGLVGAVVIFVKNYKNKNYFKKYLIVSIIVIIVTGAISIPYSMHGAKMRANKICGSDGNLYYCESEETISCDNAIAVKNGSSYKCISEDDYKQNYLHMQFDYTCIGKNETDTSSGVTSLMLEEKACLENKIESTMKSLINKKKQEFASKYDVRDKVNVTAGNQGSSDTCEIWSSTKALEISAQLKGLDYQYLVDFESKINSLDANINGIISDDETSITLGSDHMIPGKKKYYAFNYYYNSIPNKNYESVYVYSRELVNIISKYDGILSKVYADKGGFNIFDELEHGTEYTRYLDNLYAKELVKKYGSAFIHTNENIQPGHRMIIIGWDDSKEAWLVLNSWGNTWSKDDYVPNSNGDGTTWIKYSNTDFVVGSANDGGNAIELIGE